MKYCYISVDLMHMEGKFDWTLARFLAIKPALNTCLARMKLEEML